MQLKWGFKTINSTSARITKLATASVVISVIGFSPNARKKKVVFLEGKPSPYEQHYYQHLLSWSHLLSFNTCALSSMRWKVPRTVALWMLLAMPSFSYTEISNPCEGPWASHNLLNRLSVLPSAVWIHLIIWHISRFSLLHTISISHPDFPTKILYTFRASHMTITCPSHPTLLQLTALKHTADDLYNLCTTSLCTQIRASVVVGVTGLTLLCSVNNLVFVHRGTVQIISSVLKRFRVNELVNRINR